MIQNIFNVRIFSVFDSIRERHNRRSGTKARVRKAVEVWEQECECHHQLQHQSDLFCLLFRFSFIRIKYQALRMIHVTTPAVRKATTPAAVRRHLAMMVFARDPIQ